MITEEDEKEDNYMIHDLQLEIVEKDLIEIDKHLNEDNFRNLGIIEVIVFYVNPIYNDQVIKYDQNLQ